jgi:hypothetical protein
MTIEVLDMSDMRVDELDKLTFSQLKDLAGYLIRCIEDEMKIVEILEKNTEIKTKMLRVGVTTYAGLLKDVSIAYEKRVKEEN